MDRRVAPAGMSVLENGLRVLKTFDRERPVQGVTEIARQVGLHKSTVSRILATFEQEGLVERVSPSGRFRLGVGLVALAGPLLADLDIRRVARPALELLTSETGETAALMVWRGGQAISVEQEISPHQVKHSMFIGTRYSDHASSSVRVFLADAGDAEVEAVVRRGLPRYTERTITDRAAFLAELASIRERGYAVNDGETSLEEIGIAAPVRDHNDVVVAAVLMSAPRYRVPPDLIPIQADRVRSAAWEISRRLGAVDRLRTHNV